ncbi:MAG: competence protein ComEC family protein [Flavobacteriaceae bacterium]|nr:competence protein ComEC family protein [Flavobacteriaceae bacterium]
MRFINFLVLKLAACLTLGTLLGFYFPTTPSIGLSMLIVLLILLLLAWIIEGKKLRLGPWFGVFTFLIFIAIGYLNLQRNQSHFQQNHYAHHIEFDEPYPIQIKITAILKADNYHHKYFGEIFRLRDKVVEGNLLVSIRNDAEYPLLEVDDKLLIKSNIQSIRGPLNPDQFSYKDYLHKQGVYHQLTLSKGDIWKVGKGEPTLKGISERIRTKVSESIQHIEIHPDAASITRALVLGERRAIGKELYGNYAAAGAIHMLAVSGLHVGILYLLFSWLLKPLEFIRLGKPIKVALIILLLWGFAFIAGLSPSVVRAVTMFSCFAFAGLMSRTSNGFNTLALSFFILILIKPNWLFHVGFQLSYLAVFFILWLQPKLFSLYRPRFVVDRHLWGLITVTLSAQIGVAPLSLYYFHQFPGLFLLTNLIVLPFLGFLLAFGILIAVWSMLGKIPHTLLELYDLTIGLLNDFVAWVAAQEFFLFQNVPLSFFKMLIIYLLTFSIFLLWKTKRKASLFGLLTSLILLLGVILWERLGHSSDQFVVFQKSRTSLMTYKSGTHLTVFSHDTLNDVSQYPLKGYSIGQSIHTYTRKPLPNVFEFHGKRVLRLDSLGLYSSSKFDIVLLSESPKVHLERLIDSVQPNLIIADGSNYRSYVERWKKTCIKRELPFHYTAEMGAYIFD